MWAIKAKSSGRNLWQADAAVDAGGLFREEDLLTLNNRNEHNATAQLQRRLQRIAQPLTESRIDLFMEDRSDGWFRDPILVIGGIPEILGAFTS